jgi:hypothetical protein
MSIYFGKFKFLSLYLHFRGAFNLTKPAKFGLGFVAVIAFIAAAAITIGVLLAKVTSTETTTTSTTSTTETCEKSFVK